MSLWLKRSAVQSTAVGPPSFDGVVSARLASRLPFPGIALRQTELDVVERCQFVGENDVHHLSLGSALRAVAVPFGHLRDILPANAYVKNTFATYLNIQSSRGPDQHVRDVSCREITYGHRIWARTKLHPLYKAIADADTRHRTCRTLLLDWTEARKYASSGVDISARGHFGGAGIDQAQRRLAGTK